VNIALLLKFIWHIPLFGWRLLVALPAAGWRSLPKRLLIFIFLFFLFAILNFLHLLGSLLDEVFFRGYRKIVIARPLFILGIPRSGTTHLQRVLANDAIFTTLQTWEAILAPTITERKLWLMLGRLLSLMLRPLSRLRLQFFRKMDRIHKLGLTEAEEDFLLLLPFQQCLLLAFLGKAGSAWWQTALFHRAPLRERQAVLDWYRVCIRKHLYFHGTHKRLLSKNPSFTPLLPDLRQAFPDGAFVACIRQPTEVLPSQISSLHPMYSLIGDGKVPHDTRQQVVTMLQDYYRLLAEQGSKIELVSMDDIRNHLYATVSRLYRKNGIVMNPAFAETLKSLDAQSRLFRSQHQYSLDDLGLAAGAYDAFRGLWPLPQLAGSPGE
jgi:hypothetical protein